MSFFGTKELSDRLTETISKKNGEIISHFLEHDRTKRKDSVRKIILKDNNKNNYTFKEPNLSATIQHP